MDKKPSPEEIIAAARKADSHGPQPRKPRPASHESRIEAMDSDGIHAGLVAFWNTAAEVTDRVVAPDAWDVITCEISDTGWLTAAAAKCQLPFHFPRTLQEVDDRRDHFRVATNWEATRTFVVEHAERLDKLSDLNDDEYSLAFHTLLAHKVAVVQAAVMDSAIVELVRRPGKFGVFASGEAEDLHEVNVIPLLGALPKPPPPQTALEVFSRLRDHTHSSVGRNCGMSFEGDAVVGVDFMGGGVNDQTLALLDDVPNLAHVCAGLKSLLFAFTEVTPPAIERLHRQLPGVRIVY